MQVSAAQLRSAFDAIVGHLEENGQSSFKIDQDFYWSIPGELRYDTYERPTNLTVGQLSEDWERVSEIAAGTNEPIGYAFVWLSEILRVIGERAVG